MVILGTPAIMSRPQQETINSTQSSQVETISELRDVRVQPTLLLRGESTPDSNSTRPRPRRRIRWSEDVVNNEGMGRKSSKGIYFHLLII